MLQKYLNKQPPFPTDHTHGHVLKWTNTLMMRINKSLLQNKILLHLLIHKCVDFFQVTNLMHTSFILQQYICYIIILNMFRAVPCSSLGGQIVLLQPLVSSLSLNGCTVCRLRADCSPLSTGILYGRYPAPNGQESGRPLGPVWTKRKTLPQPGFNSLTSQHEASRRTDYCILAASTRMYV